MALAPDSRIGTYIIESQLGEGGMGTVYRARDPKLGRSVAIKVLSDALAHDVAFLTRFEREARILASLSHPNIAVVHGFEQSDGVHALVMELVAGPTLEDLAQSRPAGEVDLDETLSVAVQIAEALEAAHEKGIIHRDLKPANIKITPDGKVKVLDFGLAKAFDSGDAASNPASSPTLVAGATRAGMILGTAAYMSPEQARGMNVDKRTDIWAFGVVLYEMLSGKRLFPGEMISDILADVLRAEIRFDALPASTPFHVRRLLQRCLDRDRKTRLRDIGEARIAMQQPAAEPAAAPPVLRRSHTAPWIAVAALASIGCVVASWVAWLAARPLDRPLIWLDADVARGSELATTATGDLPLAISPDGKNLVFLVQGKDQSRRLAIRHLDQHGVTPINGTENAYSPFFSPDSQWIGFMADGKLKKVSILGGVPVALCDAGIGLPGGSWGDDGNIIVKAGPFALSRCPSIGGVATPVTTANAGEVHRSPHVLPGSKAFLFTSATSNGESSIEAISLADGRRKSIHRGGNAPQYLPTGHLLFGVAGTLFAAPFDVVRLELTGTPVPIADVLIGGAAYAVSNTGVLVYRAGREAAPALRSLSWLDSSGALRSVHPDTGIYESARFSPDGKRLVVVVRSGQLSLDLWMKDIDRGSFSRLTFLSELVNAPAWTPDGKYIFFSSRKGNTPGIFYVPADGSREPSEALRLDDGAQAVPRQSFSPDGKLLVFHRSNTGIFAVSVEWIGNKAVLGKPEPLVLHRLLGHPRISPDGRWLAYTSAEGTASDVYVRPLRSPAGKWQVTTGGGNRPEWSSNGHELFFVDSQGRVNSVQYTSSAGAFQPGRPRVWSEYRISRDRQLASYDLAPDGKRIMAITSPDDEQTEQKITKLTFLLNFFDEVRRRTTRP